MRPMKPPSLNPLPWIAGAVLIATAGAFVWSGVTAKTPPPAAIGSSRETRHHHRASASPGPVAGSRALIEAMKADDIATLESSILALVKNDAGAAAALVSSLPDDDTGRMLLCRIAQIWAGHDPRSAADWSGAIRNDDLRLAFLETVCFEFAGTDPAASLDLMSRTIGWDAIPPTTAGNLAWQWARRDYDAALRWARNLQQDSSRDEVFHRLALTRAESAPEDAAFLVSDWMSPGSSQDEAALFVASRWAEIDPSRARAWVETFPDDSIRKRGLQEIAMLSAEKPAD